jgi:hypothetical protein
MEGAQSSAQGSGMVSSTWTDEKPVPSENPERLLATSAAARRSRHRGSLAQSTRAAMVAAPPA